MGKMFYNNFGKFVIFVSLLTFASSVAGPFFSVYLLKNLNIPALKGGYVFYFIITLSASVATILFMPLWGKLSDKYGNLRVMKITGIFIPLVAIFYLLSSFFNTLTYAIIFIFFIEAFSGFIWAGFNLAASNFIYDAVTAQRHALCVAYFNILNGTGAFTGAMLGGIIASFDFVFFGLNSILFIFLLSGILRLAVYFVMVRKIKEVRDVPNFDLFSGKRKFKFFGD
jgi:MFS family permease